MATKKQASDLDSPEDRYLVWVLGPLGSQKPTLDPDPDPHRGPGPYQVRLSLAIDVFDEFRGNPWSDNDGRLRPAAISFRNQSSGPVRGGG